ncbi:hypothetical protein QE152_g29982 [Popillia japonica]|uniref:Uncharacterized protein n=1 Tax=Popillia japonica TaxID=7064 RepID=A0AAW1JG91_POPJA
MLPPILSLADLQFGNLPNWENLVPYDFHLFPNSQGKIGNFLEFVAKNLELYHHIKELIHQHNAPKYLIDYVYRYLP